MKFQITPTAKHLILNRGCQIMLSIEKEQCYACAGEVSVPYLSARLGKPNDSQISEYKIISEDDISIYVNNGFDKFDTSVTLAIELSDSHKETLAIYGLVI
ncbi:MAG: hypothetical protein H6Q73_1809 [Firmicutes bacterium]|nr:hypothetical protein [Bacillota bacterium]